jgi:hypothetical protein
LLKPLSVLPVHMAILVWKEGSKYSAKMGLDKVHRYTLT